MRLPIALDLRRLVQALPLRARFGIFAIDRLAGEGLDDREHPAVREIAVMGDREHAPAGLVLVGRQPFPQIARIVAAERRHDRIRHDAAGLVATVAEDHVAVEIVAAGVRRPLVADERGEPAGIVGLLRRLDGLLPGGAVKIALRRIDQRLRELALRKGDDDLDRRVCALAADDHVVPLPAGRIGHDRGLAGEQVRKEAHVVRMVGNHQEIEGARQFGRLSRGRRYLLALGEAIGIAWHQPRSECPGIERERRVEMGVAEQRPGWEVAARIGRIRPLRREELGCLLRVEGADIGLRRLGGRGQRRGKAERTGQQNPDPRRPGHVFPPRSIVRRRTCVG